MKKLMKILGLLFLSMTILSSCEDKKSEEENKKDKYKKEIKDPCDILDYSVEIFEDLEALSDEYDDIDELEDDKKDKEKVDDYFDELEDAWKYAFKKFDEDMGEVFDRDCENNDEMDDAWDEIEDFYEERLKEFQDFIRKEIDNMEEEYYEEEYETEEVTEEEYYYGEEYETEKVTEEEYYYGEKEADAGDAAASDEVATEEYIQYYHIVDSDGWTNMRYNPNGEIIRKVYSDEEFLVILENEGWSYVMFDDGSSGYIHSSRIYETY